MVMLSRNQIEAIEAYDRGEFSRAIELVDRLDFGENQHPRMLFVRADSLYDLGDDLGALEGYVGYLVRFPNGHRKNYALMAIAMVMKNLSLEAEALAVLRLVDSEHEGLGKEVEDSEAKLGVQKKAREMLGPLCGALGFVLGEEGA
jgi:hypothetical protein